MNQIQVNVTSNFGPNTALKCATPKCGTRFMARVGFVSTADMQTATTRETIIERVNCGCVRGTRVNLMTALDMLQRRQERQNAHRATREWAGRGARQRSEQERGERMSRYAFWFAANQTVHTTARNNEFPQPVVIGRPALDGEQGQGLGCGLPRHLCCCDGRRPAKDFIVVGAQVIGVCGFGGYVFRQVRKELIGRDRKASGANRLRTYETAEVAELVAAHERGEHDVAERKMGLRHKAAAKIAAGCPICERGQRTRQ